MCYYWFSFLGWKPWHQPTFAKTSSSEVKLKYSLRCDTIEQPRSSQINKFINLETLVISKFRYAIYLGHVEKLEVRSLRSTLIHCITAIWQDEGASWCKTIKNLQIIFNSLMSKTEFRLALLVENQQCLENMKIWFI